MAIWGFCITCMIVLMHFLLVTLPVVTAASSPAGATSGAVATSAAWAAVATAAVEATVPEGPGLTKSTNCTGTYCADA
jgi:hypothetical protein